MKHSILLVKLVSYLCAAALLLAVSLITLIPHILFKLSSELADRLRDDLQNMDI